MQVPRRDCSSAIGNAVAHVVVVPEVEADAAAVVAVERLDHHGEPDPACRGHRVVGVAHRLLLRHRQPGRAEQPGRQVLVGGDVDGDRAGLGGHRRPDALGVDALTELDQGVLVEPDPRDVAADGLVEDRLRRRTERRALGADDEALELAVPVELRVGLDQVVDQPGREPAGGEPDVLVDVAVDDVVAAAARPSRLGSCRGGCRARRPAAAPARVLGDVARARCPRGAARRSRPCGRASTSGGRDRAGPRAGAR